MTPDADPAWLYTDSLIGIVPERGLNNGQPSSHATWIDAAAPKPGEHVVHVGAGVGYYSAIMAQMVGLQGKVTAIEYESELAARCAANLAALPHVQVVQGDGVTTPMDGADVIYVNAGVSRPVDHWLDSLKDGGRLILPLTTTATTTLFPGASQPSGCVVLITRHGDRFDARCVSAVAVYPCRGFMHDESDRALAEAFRNGGYKEVKRLRRTSDAPEVDCWVQGKGWALTYR